MATQGVNLSLNQRPGKSTITDVQKALMNLGPYSNVTDSNGEELLRTLGSKILDAVFNIMVEKGISECINLVRYVYNGLRAASEEKDDQHSEDGELRGEDGELHIVLVGKGSISDQTHPANWLVPQDTITDTILYPPWNCAIDADVAYGISTGSILPEHRVFRYGEPQGPLPEHWNSMAAQGLNTVPEISLSPMENEAEWNNIFAELETLYANHNRRVIPYPPEELKEFIPAVPLHEIVAVIASLLEFHPPHKATIYLAAGLEYAGAQPPNEELWQNQYARTNDGTVMTMRKFPEFYDVLQRLFNQNGN